MLALDRPSAIATAGNGLIAAGEPDPRGGIVVQRLTMDGSPAPGFGTGGTAKFALDSDPGEPEVWYTADDVLVAGGRIEVAATRHEQGSSGPGQCEQRDAEPILVDADGGLVKQVDASGVLDHLMPGPGDTVIGAGPLDFTGDCGRFPEHSHGDVVQPFDVDFEPQDASAVMPILEPPTITVQGPPTGPATSLTFHFAVTEGPFDFGKATVECALDSASAEPCPVDETVTGIGLGDHAMRATAIGINGATSDAFTWRWTVTAPSVVTPAPSPSPSPPPTATPTPVEPKATLARKAGKVRLTVRAPAGTKVRIAPQVKKHKLKARTFTVGASGVLTKTVKLDKRAKRLVKAAKKPLKLKVRLVITEPGGAKVVQTRTVRLKA